MEIPEHIQKGMASGQYVRDAAGVIRYAEGTPNGGQIVAHLKEIGAYTQSGGGLMVPFGATMAIQVAGFLYIGYQLKNLQKAIECLHGDVKKIVDMVEKIYERQWLENLTPISCGVETLLEAQFKDALLEDANRYFREARAGINQFVAQQKSSALIEYLPLTDQLVDGLSVSLSGEYCSLAGMGSDRREIDHVLARYHYTLKTLDTRVNEFIREQKKIPSAEDVKAYKNFPHVPDFRKKLNDGCDLIDGERNFIYLLDQVEPKELEQLRSHDRNDYVGDNPPLLYLEA
jgi:hypothetical protein